VEIGFSFNITISDNVCNKNTERGFHLVSSRDCVIRNNIASENAYGVFLEYCENISLWNNSFTQNNQKGIHFYRSNNNSLDTNVVSHNGEGIYFDDSKVNRILNNAISKNGIGILLDGSDYYGYSSNNSVHGNDLTHSTEYAISIFDNGGNGINATGNWWGHDSGPYHPERNPDGKGDNISDAVEFHPWRGNYPFIELISPNPARESDTILFKGRSLSDPIRFSWRSSIDGEFYNGGDMAFPYGNLSNGSHMIFLRVQDNDGVWSNESTSSLYVNGRPVARIDSVIPTYQVQGADVEFLGHASDDGSISRYLWRSSIDGEFRNGSEESFTYNGLSNGTHTIYFSVQDNNGSWSYEDPISILINGIPRAVIESISPNPGYTIDDILFTGNGSDDVSIIGYAWRSPSKGEFYNGSQPYILMPFFPSGIHDIYYKVKDNNDCWSEEVRSTLIIHRRPTAIIISIRPKPGDVGETITYTGDGSDDGRIVLYEWDFNGDGIFDWNSTTTGNSTHVFYDPGTYHGILRVTDDLGGNDTESMSISIKTIPPDPDFIVTSYYEPEVPINDTNDGDENGFIDVFYGDRISIRETVYNPSELDLNISWEFKCISNGFRDLIVAENISGVVGEDLLYPGMEWGKPIIPDHNTDPQAYTATIYVNTSSAVYTRFYFIRVHPYAQADFIEQVQLEDLTLDATVTLTWRGFEEEAAPNPDYISPSMPVFVHINETDSPVGDLTGKGGIGKVYEIEAEGCRLQNGSRGFVKAEIKLPYLESDLQALGDLVDLQEDLRLEYYDVEEEKFRVVPGSTFVKDDEKRYVIGTTNDFSVFTVIVDSMYNESHPDYAIMRPDLEVTGIVLSRSPILNGQKLRINAYIRNHGNRNARDVDVSLYNGEIIIGNVTVELVSTVGDDILVEFGPYQITMADDAIPFEELSIKVIANQNRTIDEGVDNYGDNELSRNIIIISSKNDPPIPIITYPGDQKTVNGDVRIEGKIPTVDTSVVLAVVPFGNNDFAWTIESITPEPVSIHSARYTLLDYRDDEVFLGSGLLADTYGLNIEDMYTYFSYQDNDRDGKVSAGDVLLVKNKMNGGISSFGDQLFLEFGTVVKVEISTVQGEWTWVHESDPWYYEWDTDRLDHGEYSIRVRSFDGMYYSEENEIIVKVGSTDGSDSEQSTTYMILLGIFIVFLVGIVILVVKRTVHDVDDQTALGKGRRIPLPHQMTPFFPALRQSTEAEAPPAASAPDDRGVGVSPLICPTCNAKLIDVDTPCEYCGSKDQHTTNHT